MGNMPTVAPKKRMTEDEYFSLLDSSVQKYEYWDGVAVAMSGASRAHSSIESNLNFRLRLQLGGRPCETHGSNLAIRLMDSYVFPDQTVVCGEPEIFTVRGIDCLRNPMAIFEVLSPSTRNNDETTKMLAYTRLSSLREYVLVDSQKVFVKHYSRASANQVWSVLLLSTMADEIYLKSVDARLGVADLYERVEFPTSTDGEEIY